MSTEHLLKDFSSILEGVASPDNQARHEAETRLAQLTAESPGPVLLLLAQIGALGVGGFQVESRQLALVLLRRVAFDTNSGLFLNAAARVPTAPFDAIPEATRGRIERVLVAGLEDEMDTRIRKALGSSTSDWVKGSAKRQRPFVDLGPVIFSLIASNRPFHRFTSYQLLSESPNLLSESLSNETWPKERLAELLFAGVNDPSIDVKIEALRALRGVMQEGFTVDERERFGPPLLEASVTAIASMPSDVLVHALEALVDIASDFPELFIASLPLLIPFLVSCIAPPSTLSGHPFSRVPHREMGWGAWEDMSAMAFEVLFNLIIADRDNVLMWQNGALVSDVVDALIGRQIASFAAEGEQCQEWIETEDLEDDDETYPVYSEEMLNRLSMILRDGSVLAAVGRQAAPLIARSEWRARYCTLMAIASVAEGCHETMTQGLQQVLNLVTPLAMDDHPRVRYGFLYCIGVMCETLHGEVQRQYSDATLQIILSMLDDSVTRVRAAAAAALTHFAKVQGAPPSPVAPRMELRLPELVHDDEEDKATWQRPSLAPRLQPILERLMSSLTNEKEPLYFRQELLDAIATLAKTERKAFVPYYRDIMDFILRTLEKSATDESQVKFVCSALMCAVQLGRAVGKGHFFGDAIPLCKIMLSIQNLPKPDEDPRVAVLGEAWVKMAKTIGKDFSPFLQFVLPNVLKKAEYTPAANDDDAWYDQSRSAEMQEKEEAFAQLQVYVLVMEEKYAPFLSDTMDVVLAAVASWGSESVREYACFLIPGLLQAAKDANMWLGDAGNLEGLFRMLINAIPHEEEATGVAQLYQSMFDSLRVINMPLPAGNVAHLIRTSLDWLRSLYEKRVDRAAEQHRYTKRTDYEEWAAIEQIDEQSEDEAVTGMYEVLKLIQHDPNALSIVGEVFAMTQKVQGARCEW
ncbi:ARM repeat-containing protein [Cutaneotrichosporon oleaginosum]|uniref:ARM repeat-containing protein n=1 Tax=Cutaneotrichosporon oleaginosum TaxID=879819 RepID=A0A0J0XSK4_9TREE|nr:ARM repeat-containing protein [Cutaneotrichosporon oleaginosum]KLT44035.1 ARM repeat-containing protein [Cutaneotrichosporon oleaginosum]TXT04019.1 hypothetical protein COLE_07716 [Cutaneotrichosporon oleaginosum]